VRLLQARDKPNGFDGRRGEFIFLFCCVFR